MDPSAFFLAGFVFILCVCLHERMPTHPLAELTHFSWARLNSEPETLFLLSPCESVLVGVQSFKPGFHCIALAVLLLAL